MSANSVPVSVLPRPSVKQAPPGGLLAPDTARTYRPQGQDSNLQAPPPTVVVQPTHVVAKKFINLPSSTAAAATDLTLGSSAAQNLLSNSAGSACILSVYELLLHFQHFRNIDLFRQGLYAIRAQFFTVGVRPKVNNPVGKDAASTADGAAGPSGAAVTAAGGTASTTSTAGASVGVGTGAVLDSRHDTVYEIEDDDSQHQAYSDVSSPSSQQQTQRASTSENPILAAIQAEIAQWEARVHELNYPPPKKDKDKEEKEKAKANSAGEDAPAIVAENAESVMVALGNSSSSPFILKKHKIALPYYVLPASPASNSNGDDDASVFSSAEHDSNVVYEACISDSTNQFISSVFRVQYCEQEMKLNDCCLFRLELNSKRKVPLYLECELLFSEYTIADAHRGRPVPPMGDFKVISRHMFCIPSLAPPSASIQAAVTNGGAAAPKIPSVAPYSQSSYIPLIFDDQHFCSLDMMLHIQLIDFKFRPPPKQATLNISSSSPAPDAVPSSMSSLDAPTLVVAVPGGPAADAPPPTAPSTLAQSVPVVSSLAGEAPAEPAVIGSLPVASAVASVPSADFQPTGSAGADVNFLLPTLPTHTLSQILFPRLLRPHLLRGPLRLTVNPQTTMQLANDYHQLFVCSLVQAYIALARKFDEFQSDCLGLLPPPSQSAGVASGPGSNSRAGKVVTKAAQVSRHLTDIPQVKLPDGAVACGDDVDPSEPSGKSIASTTATLNSEPSISRDAEMSQSGVERSVSSASRLGDNNAGDASGDPAAEADLVTSIKAWGEDLLTGLTARRGSEEDNLVATYRSSQPDSDEDGISANSHSNEPNPSAKAVALSGDSSRFGFPLLYTLSHRMRHFQSQCCVWCNPDLTSLTMLQDLQSLSQQLFTIWNQYQSILPFPLYADKIRQFEKNKYYQLQRQKYHALLFREVFDFDDRWRLSSVAAGGTAASSVNNNGMNLGELHGKIVSQLRSNNSLALFTLSAQSTRKALATISASKSSNPQLPLPVRDCQPNQQLQEQAVLFEEQYKLNYQTAQIAASYLQPMDQVQIIDSHFAVPKSPAATVHKSAQAVLEHEHPSIVSGSSIQAMEHSNNIISDSIGKGAIVNKSPVDKSDSMAAPNRSPSASPPAPATSLRVDSDPVARTVEAHSAQRREAARLARPYEGKHMWVFVHGYQGNSWDMRLSKNQLMLHHPHCEVFVSTSNENQTEGDIQQMGHRLALELATHLQANFRLVSAAERQEHGSGGGGGTPELGRLSFLAHSLGGLIVRAALCEPLLQPYLSKCYTFMSLATPHCGYLFSENAMLQTGIWLLKKWNKSVCLSQLSFSDQDELNQCYLYKLSEKKTLYYFRNVFLFASYQDKYAPFHSARIEMQPFNVGPATENHSASGGPSSENPSAAPASNGSNTGSSGGGSGGATGSGPLLLDRKKLNVYQRMVENILGSFHYGNANPKHHSVEAIASAGAADPSTSGTLDLRRFDLWFAIKKKQSVDNFIGRTAHILFLTETNYMQMVFQTYAHLFQ